MLTRTAPIFAVATWVTIQFAWFIIQSPTRSPFSTPSAMRPRASASACSCSSRYVHRIPSWTETMASVSG